MARRIVSLLNSSRRTVVRNSFVLGTSWRMEDSCLRIQDRMERSATVAIICRPLAASRIHQCDTACGMVQFAFEWTLFVDGAHFCVAAHEQR